MISRDLLLILGLCLVVLLPAHCQRPTRRSPTRATQCRATGNLEIPGYCRVYLACGTANGEGSVMRCPEGTTFNGDIGNCDNIELSDHRCFRGTNNNNNRRPINNNNNFNTRRPNNNNNNFNTRRPNNNNNFNTRRPNNNNNNFNTRRPNNNNNNFNTRRPNNNNNFNTRRPNNNNNNNQRNGRRNVFQGSPQISVPLTLPRGQAGDCQRLENEINNDFRSRVRGAAGRDVPNIPTLRLECTFQNRNQNQNQNWSQVRG